MHIILSSGFAQLFKENILSVLALPKGASVRFRYRIDKDEAKSRIEPRLRDIVRNSQFKVDDLLPDGISSHSNHEISCLICYIDQFDQEREPTIIPYRVAVITAVQRVGETVFLDFLLKDFVLASDVREFNKEARKALPNLLPSWTGDDDKKKIMGYYWAEITQFPTPGWVKRLVDLNDPGNLTIWEEIVEQIAGRPDFVDEKCFFTIKSLRDVKQNKVIELNNGSYILQPNRDYALQIYSYHPTNNLVDSEIHCQSLNKVIVVTGPTTFDVKARYDLREIMFTTTAKTSKQTDVIEINRTDVGSSNRAVTLNITVQIKANTLPTAMLALAAGVVIGLPQISLDLINPTLIQNPHLLYRAISIAVGQGIVAALLTNFFGSKR